MDQNEINNLIYEFGRNYPDWIKNAIGSKLDESNRLLKSISDSSKISQRQGNSSDTQSSKANKDLLKNTSLVNVQLKKMIKLHEDLLKNATDAKKVVEEEVKTSKESNKQKKTANDLDRKTINSRKTELKNIDDFGYALKSSTNQLKNASKQLATSVMKNDLGGAVSSITTGLTTITDKFGVLGKSIGTVIAFGGMTAEYALNVAQKNKTAFTELNKYGVSVSGGLNGLAQAAAQGGLKVEELVESIAKSRTAFLALGADSAAQFARTSYLLNDTNTAFRKLGYNVADINDFLSANLEYQRATGQLQKLSDKQRAADADSELKRLSKLSSVLGISVKDIMESTKNYANSPKAMALMMQAGRNMSDSDRKKMLANQAQGADMLRSYGFEGQDLDKLMSVVAVEVARRNGTTVTDPEAIRSAALLEQMAPDLAKILRSMADPNAQISESAIAGALEKENKRAWSGNNPASVAILNGIDNSLNGIFGTLFTGFANTKGLTAGGVQDSADAMGATMTNPEDQSSALLSEFEKTSRAITSAIEGPLQQYLSTTNPAIQGITNGLNSVTTELMKFNQSTPASKPQTVVDLVTDFLKKPEVIASLLAAITVGTTGAVSLGKGALSMAGKTGNILGGLGGSLGGKLAGAGAARIAGQEGAEKLGWKGFAKMAGKGLGKLGGRLLPGAGWALTANDIYQVYKDSDHSDFSNVNITDYTGQITDPAKKAEVKRLVKKMQEDFKKTGAFDPNDSMSLFENSGPTTSAMIESMIMSGVNIPQLASGGVAKTPMLTQIAEGGRPEMVMPLDPAMSDLADHIATSMLEIYGPFQQFLNRNLVNDLFVKNYDILKEVHTKSLDQFFFSKQDITSTFNKMSDSNYAKDEFTQRQANLMSAMGINVQGGFSGFQALNGAFPPSVGGGSGGGSYAGPSGASGGVGPAGLAGGAADAAMSILGAHEVTDRQKINQYLKEGGIDLDAATTAWCAAFVNASLAKAGIKGSGSNLATDFATWGTAVDPAQVAKGDVLVDTRGNAPGSKGGHAGIATGQTRQGANGLEIEMVSGNSGNKVTKSWYSASRLGVRRANQQTGGTTGHANGDLQLSEKDIVDLKKALQTEWVQSAGNDQAYGIIDTILNRTASGKWGTTVKDVLDARGQFSDINSVLTDKKGRNSVDQLPASIISNAVDNIVDTYLAKRAAGQGSSVGDNLNYANPFYSSPSNLRWINALQGPIFGSGKAIHRHGTTPDLERYRPGAFGISIPGMENNSPVATPVGEKRIPLVFPAATPTEGSTTRDGPFKENAPGKAPQDLSIDLLTAINNGLSDLNRNMKKIHGSVV